MLYYVSKVIQFYWKEGEFFVVEVRRKEGESTESMVRRFTRKVQQSGVLIRARKNRYRQKIKSKNVQRTNALKRAEMREEREELRRMGKLDVIR